VVEEDKKRWVERHGRLNLGLKISLAGAYGLSAVFVFASTYWQGSVPHSVFDTDPYLNYAVFFGVAGLVLTFLNIVIDKL
jgi:hypothetical protein